MTPPAPVLQHIEKVVGTQHFLSDAAGLAVYEVDGSRPAAAALPGSADEVAEVVRQAAAEEIALIPSGARTALGIGAPPVRYDLALDLSRLNRVIAYDPGDLTLSVEAGMRLSDLQTELARHGQFLPLAQPFGETCTIGGVLAANLSGPLRQFYGTARDFVLGMEFVSGEGARTKSGGRVVKNVAGTDLHKLLIGSLGTLGVITLANFRTFPQPPATGTFVSTYERLADALALRAAVAASPLTPHAIEIVSPGGARLLDRDARHLAAGRWSVAIAAGGEQSVVERVAHDLERMAGETRAESFARIEENEKAGLWLRIREFPRLAREASPLATILKISVLPGGLAPLLAAAESAARKHALPAATLVRGAGIVYFALLPAAETEEDAVTQRIVPTCRQLFEAAHAQSARAVIEWAPVAVKRAVSVWGNPAEDWGLMQRIKKTLNPHGILAPGRFVGGI
jgi:glycolate oxidase FAD binding subunit